MCKSVNKLIYKATKTTITQLKYKRVDTTNWDCITYGLGQKVYLNFETLEIVCNRYLIAGSFIWC